MFGWETAISRIYGESKVAKADESGGDGNEETASQFHCVACNKTFMNEAVFHHHKKGKRHIKAINALSKQITAPSIEQSNLAADFSAKKGQYSESQIVKLRQVAFNETLILRLLSLLHEVLQQTQNQVRKKQSSSYQEIEAEKESLKAKDILAKAVTIAGDDSDEDRVKYNPKNLPMGWDGKPIPYWLYKLHGLGKEFKCEICGGASYWGRRAFEKHF